MKDFFDCLKFETYYVFLSWCVIVVSSAVLCCGGYAWLVWFLLYKGYICWTSETLPWCHWPTYTVCFQG